MRGIDFPFGKAEVRAGQQGFKNNAAHLGSLLAALVLSGGFLGLRVPTI